MPAQQHPIYALKAELFRVLGHPTRVRILELLADGERIVGDLQAELELDSSSTSQHLGALRRLGVLDSRRHGANVFYSIRDPRVLELLRIGRTIVTANVEHVHALLTSSDTPGDSA